MLRVNISCPSNPGLKFMEMKSRLDTTFSNMIRKELEKMLRPKKEHPIIFNTDMVWRVTNGIKTQTRRPIKPQPFFRDGSWHWDHKSYSPDKRCDFWDYFEEFLLESNVCPLGEVGDRLWVKETFGYDKEDRVIYRANRRGFTNQPKWRPSIHMSRSESRVLLEITALSVEQIQEISYSDYFKEGFRLPTNDWRADFGKMWNEIYEAKGYGWEANPYVWVVEFKIVELMIGNEKLKLS